MTISTGSISVYQSIDTHEKIINYSSQPELVYSKLTTLSLLIRQVKDEGVGLIFCRHKTCTDSLQKELGSNNVVVLKKYQLNQAIERTGCNTRIIVIQIGANDIIKISDLHEMAQLINLSGFQLKWISILQQINVEQLFKWELKYN